MKYYITSPGYRAEITKGKANKLVSASRKALEISLLEEKYDYLIENYLELEEENFRIASRYLVLGSFGFNTFQNDRGSLARRIINLLTACRIYLDHTPHHLKKIFITDGEAKKFKEVTHMQYESSLEYRFVEALRNYVQHRGLPIHSITYGEGVVDYPRDKRVKYLVVPRILLEELSTDTGFKKSVLNEMLDSHGKEVSAIPILRVYVERLSTIHDETRKLLDREIDRARRFLFGEKEWLEKRKVSEDGNLLLGFEKINAKGYQVEEQYFPLYVLPRIAELRKRNKQLTRLANTFITNEADIKKE